MGERRKGVGGFLGAGETGLGGEIGGGGSKGWEEIRASPVYPAVVEA